MMRMLAFLLGLPLAFIVCSLFILKGTLTLQDLLSFYCGSYEQALTELNAMSLDTIRHELEMFMKIYLTGLGADLPHGYTWGDLVSELSQGSTNKEYLLGILADMIREGTRSEWTIKALQILDRRLATGRHQHINYISRSTY